MNFVVRRLCSWANQRAPAVRKIFSRCAESVGKTTDTKQTTISPEKFSSLNELATHYPVTTETLVHLSMRGSTVEFSCDTISGRPCATVSGLPLGLCLTVINAPQGLLSRGRGLHIQNRQWGCIRTTGPLSDSEAAQQLSKTVSQNIQHHRELKQLEALLQRSPTLT